MVLSLWSLLAALFGLGLAIGVVIAVIMKNIKRIDNIFTDLVALPSHPCWLTLEMTIKMTTKTITTTKQ